MCVIEKNTFPMGWKASNVTREGRENTQVTQLLVGVN